jgi:hypothetical protein
MRAMGSVLAAPAGAELAARMQNAAGASSRRLLVSRQRHWTYARAMGSVLAAPAGAMQLALGAASSRK